MKTYTTVGVTGHIDHGKTSLVAKLTGVDTDTHPEEKRRGITIDLGFAALTEEGHTFAFIDAPGHQKYVGNLLAGVSAVDIGLLVVACDQGIQKQTLEHAAILRTLGVPHLIVALSRVDLVEDQDRRAELVEELNVFLSDFEFDSIPIVQISSVTGAGIDELKQELRKAAAASALHRDWRNDAHFRMPIDRVLQVEGRGLVVAGTVWSGRVSVGDSVQLAGQLHALRVREIESHGEMVEHSQLGYRTAINLTGTIEHDVKRGDELVACGTHQPRSRLVVALKMYPEAASFRCPATVQMQLATCSCSARISGRRQLSSGPFQVVVVESEQPVVATFNQACLFRKPYPVGAFGGGRVLAAIHSTSRKNKELIQLGETLAATLDSEDERPTKDSAVQRLLAWVAFEGEFAPEPEWCELQLGYPASALPDLVNAASAVEDVLLLDGRLVSQALMDRAQKAVLRILTLRDEGEEDAWSVRESIVKRVEAVATPVVIAQAIRNLLKQKAIVELRGMLALATENTLLSKKQRAKMDELLALFTDTRTPPSTKELAAQLSLTSDALNSLLRHATQQGALTEFGKGLYMSTEVFQTLSRELRGLFTEQSELSVPAIKDLWGVSRKYAIPLLEYCDAQGLTVRRQDARSAGPKLPEAVSSQ